MKRKKWSQSDFGITFRIIFFTSVLLLLLSDIACFFDPEPFWIMAMFGLAYPVILLVNIVLLGFLIVRKHLYLFIVLAVILAGFKSILSSYGLAKSVEDSIGKLPDDLRVLTYNVHSFKKYGSEYEGSTRTKILDIIRYQSPDIVCFQEFYSRKRGVYNLIDSMRDIMGAKGFYFHKAIKNNNESIGLAIFSKYAIINKGYVTFENRNVNGCVWVDVNFGGKSVRVYNIHLASIGLQKDDYNYLKIGETDESKDASSKRIGRRLKRAFIRRSRQVKMLQVEMARCKTPYVVAGDFNDTPNSYSVRAIGANMLNTFEEKGSGYGITYNGLFPNFQIDYIFASKDFWVRNYVVVKQKLSDHYPVRSDLSLQ